MSIKVVTDSTADLPVDIVNELDIKVVPLNVHFGEDVYRDGVELSAKEFMDRLVSGIDMPSTSQPSAGEFLNVYREISLLDHTVLALHVSEELSGTLNSARQGAAELADEDKIHIIDSRLVSMGLGLAVISAARAAKSGKSLDEIIEIAKSVANRCRFFVMLDTLEYLERGGRIGKASALLGGLLRIKPILTLNNGEVDSFGRARSRKSGILKIEEAVSALGPLERVAVIYNGAEEEAQELANRITGLHDLDDQPTLSELGPVISTHAGPNALGVVVVCRE